MMKKWLSLVMVLAMAAALAGTLAGCASSKGAAAQSSVANYAVTDTSGASPRAATKQASAAAQGSEGASGGTSEVDLGGESSVQAQSGSRKIVLNATLSMEAIDFDATCSALMQALQSANGYVSSTNISTPSTDRKLRSADYVLRVPADTYSAFLTHAGEAGNLLNKQESTDDISAAYVDVEARLKSLKMQEERLYAMLDQAGELETLLAIQKQLTDVQYQIESYTAQKRVYDDKTAYSTVRVHVAEVRRETSNPNTFSQRVGTAFASSWHNFGVGMQNFAVGLIYALPLLLVLAALAVVVLLAARALRRRKAARRAKLGAPVPAQYAAPQGPSAQSAPAVPQQPGEMPAAPQKPDWH